MVPYFNEAKFLPQTLESLLRQELQPQRLVLVDNDSSDGSEDICREFLASTTDIEIVYLRDLRPGKIHALQTGFARVGTEYVAFCDADTIYPPHYLRQAQLLFERSPSNVIAVMATGVQDYPDALRSKIRRAWVPLISIIFRKQAHTGGYGHCFKTAALKQVGGYSHEIWPYVLSDHEIMQRLFKVGVSRYHFDMWCMPSARRTDRASVRWNLFERVLYHLCSYPLKDWYFYRFLGPRFAQRNLTVLKLRERAWEQPPS